MHYEGRAKDREVSDLKSEYRPERHSTPAQARPYSSLKFIATPLMR